jgi:hypothetical protein
MSALREAEAARSGCIHFQGIIATHYIRNIIEIYWIEQTATSTGGKIITRNLSYAVSSCL